MADWQSTGDWAQVDIPAIEPLISSNQTVGLDPVHWPGWAQGSTQMNRLWVYCPDDENAPSVPGSTVKVVARLLTERVDQKDAPEIYNYNFYMIAESSDGRYFQSPPIKTTDPPHRSTAPAQWLDASGPPPI